MQRMEEPSAPTWDDDSQTGMKPWSPPLDEDVPFAPEVSHNCVFHSCSSVVLNFLPVNDSSSSGEQC